MAANVLWRTIALVAVTAVAAAIMGAGQPQALPDIPNVFNGAVTFAGEPAPDGVEIFARVGSYQSNVARPGFEAHERPIVLTEGGRYENLKVQPTGTNNIGRSISFFATYGNGEVQAEETINVSARSFLRERQRSDLCRIAAGSAGADAGMRQPRRPLPLPPSLPLRQVPVPRRSCPYPEIPTYRAFLSSSLCWERQPLSREAQC